MFTEDRRVTGEIMDLLKKRAQPVKVKEIVDYVGVPMHMINMSISRLVREQLVIVESKEGENFLVMAVYEVSSR
ncbi:MAG: hypothetical protein HZA28_00070 [Candidatus Omnitrophica bacterium]|nr:hypothetical protein [Candidatus Omnitrophota bacterium]